MVFRRTGLIGVSAVRWDARGPLHRLKMVFRRTMCELGYQFWLIATAAYGPVVQNSQESILRVSQGFWLCSSQVGPLKHWCTVVLLKVVKARGVKW